MTLPPGQHDAPIAAGLSYVDPALAGKLSALVDEFRRPQQAHWRIVKRNASRTVYRKSVAGLDIYLKHFHSPSRLRRLAVRLGYSDARRETLFARRLREAGVATPRVLAAEYGSAGRQWVATEAVESAEPGDAWHARLLAQGPAGQKEIARGLRALAGVVARMHAAGVIHYDLHCGNVLMQHEGKSLVPYVMDLHRMGRRARLSRRRRAWNLAQLLHNRYEFSTASQRLRFLKLYLEQSGAGGTLRGWALLIEDFARRHRRRLYAGRDKRIGGDGRYFERIGLGNSWRATVLLRSRRCLAGSYAAGLTFTAEQWAQTLAEPQNLLTGPGVTVIKDSPSGQVVRRMLMVGGQNVDVYIKRPCRKKRWKLLADCLREGRMSRAFRQGHELLTRHIATALPLAVLERRVGPLPVESVLICEAVDAPCLDDFLNARLSPPTPGESVSCLRGRRFQAQRVLEQMGRMLRRLHEEQYAHRDLKSSNMLVRWEKDRPEIVLVDLDGLKRLRCMTARRRFQGLMRLNVSLLRCPPVTHAGRLRMLLGYLGRGARAGFKPYWRVVDEWSGRKLRQQIESRRRKQRAGRRPA